MGGFYCLAHVKSYDLPDFAKLKVFLKKVS